MYRTWHIVTGEYPPQTGGIADYAGRLVAALRGRGAQVQVWAPGETLPRGFGPAGLRAIGRGIDASRAAGTRPVVLVQYAPNAFGMRGANILLCAWLAWRAWRHGDDIRVMFHEPFFYFARQSLRRNALALVHRVMAALLLASARIAYVSTGSWESLLARYSAARRAFVWLPIPATVLPPDDPEGAARVRSALIKNDRTFVVGHFGSYPDDVASELQRVLGAMLAASGDANVLLIGRNSDTFLQKFTAAFPEHDGRLTATGEIVAGELGHNLRACDLLVQPYPDGATTRRTSLMAPLACAVPTVTTIGMWSEPIWSGARDAIEFAPAGDAAAIVARCQGLANDPARRRALGRNGRAFYERHFTIDRTLRILCGAESERPQVLLGVSAYPTSSPENARRQHEALTTMASLEGVLHVNLQFVAAEAAPIDVDGYETVRGLELDSITVAGRMGARKPIASETFDLLARRALEEGCRYFAYLNSDTVLSQEVVDRVCAGDADAYAIARTDVGSGRSPEVLIAGVDGFVISTEWWTANRRRFRAYILGEPVWDCVYAALVACHGRAEFVYDTGGLTHERHPTQWVASPFASYVRYLSALDAPYFSLWCAYNDRIRNEVDLGRGFVAAARIAQETFVWRPSTFARAIQASRCVKGWVRYVAGEAVA
jgi:glycosyltransferase involved in cell wall biosynthesis